jgi:hypothetical protein
MFLKLPAFQPKANHDVRRHTVKSFQRMVKNKTYHVALELVVAEDGGRDGHEYYISYSVTKPNWLGWDKVEEQTFLNVDLKDDDIAKTNVISDFDSLSQTYEWFVKAIIEDVGLINNVKEKHFGMINVAGLV